MKIKPLKKYLITRCIEMLADRNQNAVFELDNIACHCLSNKDYEDYHAKTQKLRNKVFGS